MVNLWSRPIKSINHNDFYILYTHRELYKQSLGAALKHTKVTAALTQSAPNVSAFVDTVQ